MAAALLSYDPQAAQNQQWDHGEFDVFFAT